MADIVHDFPVAVDATRVFEALSTPDGLNHWWTARCTGTPRVGAEYELGFGPGEDWRAEVIWYERDREFELEMIDADEDWRSTRVGFSLAGTPGGTHVQFRHTRWSEVNDHFRRSSYCWAMYLRLLVRFLEHGEHVRYEDRLRA